MKIRLEGRLPFRLSLGELGASDFEIQVGAMDYGFPIQGLVGMDFLLSSAAVIDLGQLEISRHIP